MLLAYPFKRLINSGHNEELHCGVDRNTSAYRITYSRSIALDEYGNLIKPFKRHKFFKPFYKLSKKFLMSVNLRTKLTACQPSEHA